MRPKPSLLRLALVEGRVVTDRPASLPGRGAYVCGAGCYERAVAAKALSRAFRCPVPTPDDTLESLDH